MRAEKYLEYWEKIKGWTHYNWPKHRKRFSQIAMMIEGETCIDIGCGFGHSTKKLSNLYRADWTGLEFSAKAIKKARENFPGLKFIHAGNYDLLAACGQRYDSVVCSEVIEHIEDDRAFLDNLMKIVRKKLILTTPNRFVNDPGHLGIYNNESLNDLLDKYFFIIKSQEDFYYIEIMEKVK